MKISRIRIQSYKSFRNSPWIDLSPSRTVVVGQNNSGKTALLQALRFGSNSNVPYRGPLPKPWMPNSTSTFFAIITLPGQAMRSTIKGTGNQVYVPVSDDGDVKAQVDALWASDELSIAVQAQAGQGLVPSEDASHGLLDDNQASKNVLIQFDSKIDDFTIFGNTGSSGLPSVLEGLRASNIYVFDPERLKIGACSVQENPLLDPSARNLPAVLSMMARNPAKWEIFKGHVREVFPSVREVAISPLGAEIAVYIWQNDPQDAQDDYAVLLQESGTGLAQVLSILYVAMTRTANVIAIDEPNSFLHPGAAKKLMTILKQYGQNQYIVSTHSPELISIIDPDVLLSVSWSEGESHVESLDRHSLNDLENVLLDLGCELADVFAADRVIWCEGPTEVRAFPILARASGLNIATTAFLELRATGDLESHKVNAQSVLDIYAILSKGPSLLPRETAFNLDREGRSSAEIADITRQSKGSVKFLPARSLENFVVDSDAISAILDADYARTQTVEAPPTREDVQAWLNKHAGEYAPKGQEDDWQADELDAPKLLDKLFSAVTNNLHIYRKTHHTVELIRWLLENKPSQLGVLTEYVRSLTEE